MLDQLLISKKLYQEGCRQHDFNDSISDGLAVSLFQDAIEIYLWTLIKEREITVGKNSDFTTNLTLITNAGLRIPNQPKLHELNKSRVNFKHYGNLPARRDAEKFRNYAQEFLIEACLEHFGISFSGISTIDLVRSAELRGYFKGASDAASSELLLPSYENLGKAQYVILKELSSRLPRFTAADREHKRELDSLRELLLIAIYKIDIDEFKFAAQSLPSTVRMVSGEFSQNHNRTKYSRDEFQRIYEFLLDLCLKQSL